MNLLVNIKFPFNFTAGICNSGEINLCDGKRSVYVLADNTQYTPNYLRETSTIYHSVNLLQGGELEECSDYVVDIVDDNLLSTLEMAGYGVNSGEVQVYLLDDAGVKSKIWFGYVVGSELSNNTLSIKCENLTKALKTLEKPVILGNNKSVKLERDSSLSNQTYKFVTNNTTKSQSKHPIIVQVDSPKYSGATTSYGVNHVYSATNTVLKVKYYAPAFPWAGGPNAGNYHLSVKFVSGANADQRYTVTSIQEVTYSDHVEAWMYLGSELQGTDIRSFDRVEIFDSGSYFLLPDGVDAPTSISIIDSATKFPVAIQDYTVTTINGKRYLVVYPSTDLYTEVPILSTSLDSDSTISKINAYKRPNVSLAVDNDYDVNNMCGFNLSDTAAHPDWSYFNLGLSPNLSKFEGRQLYFGVIMDYSDYLTTSRAHIRYKLKSGEIYPTNSDGSYSSDISTSFWNVDDRNHVPLRSIPPTAIPKTNVTVNYTFDKSQMVQLIDPDVNLDIEQVILCVIKTRTSTDAHASGQFEFPKIGIYAQANVADSLDAVYIDYVGNAADSSVCGMDDRIAKEILVSNLGQTVESTFVTSNPNDKYQHFYSRPGTTAEEALSTLAKESLSVIGSKEDREIYRKPLVVTQDDTKVDLVIPSAEIISVQPLKDIALTDFINLPKISFKDPSGNVEYFEVVNLDSEFPSQDDFVSGAANYSKFFRFSDNFISTIRANSTKTNGDVFLYWLLSSVYEECRKSYLKNATLRNGEIPFETIYLNEFFVDVLLGYTAFLDIIKLNTQRRKTVELVLPLDYGTTTPLRLGQRIKLFHPNLMQNNSLYGFLQTYEMSVVGEKPKTTITVLVDSYKLGNGDVNFF